MGRIGETGQDESEIGERELSRSLLRATLEATADGILVVDLEGRVVLHNRRFQKVWRIGAPEEPPAEGDAVFEWMASRTTDPAAFRETLETLSGQPGEIQLLRVDLTDGRVVEVYSRPQRFQEKVVGRVWSFRDVSETHHANRRRWESEARYRRLFMDSRHAVYVTAPDGSFLEANPAALEMLRVAPGELKTLNSVDLYVDAEERLAFEREIGERGSVVDYPVRLKRTDGSEIDCLLTTTLRRGPDGTIEGYEGIVQDVTEQLGAARALEDSEQTFRALIENASDTITILDATGRIVYESPSLERVLGYLPEDLVGQNVFEYVHPEDRAGAVGELGRLLEGGDYTVRVELRFLHGNGSWRWMEVIARNLLATPGIEGVVVNARDITERRAAEEQLVHDAFHDRLTGLPNRALLLDRVQKLVRGAERANDRPFSILFLDLDRFKVVNDSLGHMVGDQLLVAVAQRLQRCLRPGDTVARLGGDEFTMLLEGADTEIATRVADRIRTELHESFILGKHEIYATVSIGIACSSTGYGSAIEMLRDADLAMYRAKDTGRARYELFDATMRDEAVERLSLETDLRNAIERHEFEVHYQPIVALDTEELVGFEALLRWAHPERGRVLPGEFLPLADDTGLIVPIGWWVLSRVCRTLADWSADPALSPVPVQVNVAAQQLGRDELVRRVRGALEAFGCTPELLHLELTEGTMMEKAESTVQTLEALKAIGVGLSIDDFGTGYSSLSYLHRFPTDSVKIDRSFVSRIGREGEDAGIVRTIIDLAHDLGMRTVAEGIETTQQAETLRTLGCEAGQGFLYSHPVAEEEARRLLTRRPARDADSGSRSPGSSGSDRGL